MEMDIYMRRRLVALGGLVLFFIFFVLLVKSCGDDEPEEPLTVVGATGTGGPVALTIDEFISQADAICAEANSAVGALDPTDPDAIREEAQITSDEYAQLKQLQVEDEDTTLRRFMAALKDVVDALEAKQIATEREDTVTADEAQLDIDTAEVEARALGDRYGFRDCGQFLDAGEAPGGADTTDAGTDTGTAPTDTGAVAPPTDTTAPPTDTTAPPADTTPPDDSGGITP